MIRNPTSFNEAFSFAQNCEIYDTASQSTRTSRAFVISDSTPSRPSTPVPASPTSTQVCRYCKATTHTINQCPIRPNRDTPRPQSSYQRANSAPPVSTFCRYWKADSHVTDRCPIRPNRTSYTQPPAYTRYNPNRSFRLSTYYPSPRYPSPNPPQSYQPPSYVSRFGSANRNVNSFAPPNNNYRYRSANSANYSAPRVRFDFTRSAVYSPQLPRSNNGYTDSRSPNRAPLSNPRNINSAPNFTNTNRPRANMTGRNDKSMTTGCNTSM